MQLNGGGYGTLTNFGVNAGDGANPLSALVQSKDGVLYGTTYNGGTSNLGTVFRVKSDLTDYITMSTVSAAWRAMGRIPIPG
jgi:uncharacterized repeat protein (TIGR03803 family)